MTPELQAAVAAILGGFGTLALKEWIPGAVRWATGRATRQKSLILEAEAEAQRLDELLDDKARALRRLEVHATALTRYLVEAGWDPNDPRLNWPRYTD